MSANYLLPLAIVFAGGVALAIQTPINGALGAASGSGLFAAAVSFGVGFAALVLVVALSSGLPSAVTVKAIPLWMWTGGVLGAFYVWSVLTNVQKLGALTLAVALFGGQLLASLIIDATGFANVTVRAISWQRIFAVVFVACGLVLSRY